MKLNKSEILKIYKLFLEDGKTYKQIGDIMNIFYEEVEEYITDDSLVRICFENDYELFSLALKARIHYNKRVEEYEGKKR